jgi:hypothetical protein
MTTIVCWLPSKLSADSFVSSSFYDFLIRVMSASFKIEKIYEFVREHQEQEEGLNALNTDFTAVSQVLARKDAAGLEEPLPMFEGMKELPKPVVPGIINLPAPATQSVPRVDPAVADLVRRFDGMTLSVEQFNYLANSNLAIRRMLSDTENYTEAYKKLVLRPQRQESAPLERNDGSFKSIYPPTMNPRQDVMMMGNREQVKTKCRGCGNDGHLIANCPDLRLMRDNKWFHTRNETTSGGWNQSKYYFGPYPNDKWGVFPGGGFAPRPFDSEILEWVLRSLKERYQVTDEQLKRPMKPVLPNWFDATGQPLPVNPVVNNGESYTVEASEDGEMLAQQTMALRAAAMFLESVSQTGEVYNAEAGAYAVETRNKGVRKAAETHRKDSRVVGKKPVVPRMKAGRLQDQIMPSVEDEEDELLRYRPVVDVDTPMREAQVDPLREALGSGITPSSESQSTTMGPEVYSAPAIRTQKRAQNMAMPTHEDLATLVKATSPNIIAQAMLNQEVRGLRQVDLLATPAVAAAITRALEAARRTSVRFQDSEHPSGETMSAEIRPKQMDEDSSVAESLAQLYDWGSQACSGESNTVSDHQGWEEVITKEVLARLCPKLSRNQQEMLRTAGAKEVNNTMKYEVGHERDGYDLDQANTPTELRLQAEKQHQRYLMTGQLPTCWVSVNGGMGRALIDTGSQLNVMRLSTARALNDYITELDQTGSLLSFSEE